MSTAKIDRRVEPSHHFNSMDQELKAGKEGVWVFMVTELMMFGGLFVAYALYRAKYPEAWFEGGHLLDWRLGALNTLVLLFSSLTMALAVRDTQMGNNKKAFNKVLITVLCALTFLVIKFFEYKGKIQGGLFPSEGLWNYEGVEGLRLFFAVYFMMTGLHGIHIIIGVGLMIWLLKRLKNNEFSPKYYTMVDGVGLYWHIVDVIWIYLFPLMYLM